jgi:hypothetical protein
MAQGGWLESSACPLYFSYDFAFNPRMRILEYTGLATASVAMQYRKATEAIAREDFRAAEVKKLVNLGHGKFYRARLDGANRLLFALVRHDGQTCAVMLEVIANHDYGKSRFLRGATVDETKIGDVDCAAARAEAQPVRYLHPERTAIHFLDKPISFMTAVLLGAGVSCAQSAGSPADTPAKSYTVLDDQGSQLRADFNRKLGSIRLLFVVDPICPTCLRGLDDMNRDLLEGNVDPRLQTFVVHEPVLGTAGVASWSRMARGQDVSKAAQLLHTSQAQHYWNASGAFGQLLSQAVGLKNGEHPVYTWEVWLIYGPEAKWASAEPPRPQLLMHQLSALRGSVEFPHLDSHVFAQQVHTLLAQLPPPIATPNPAHSPQ